MMSVVINLTSSSVPCAWTTFCKHCCYFVCPSLTPRCPCVSRYLSLHVALNSLYPVLRYVTAPPPPPPPTPPPPLHRLFIAVSPQLARSMTIHSGCGFVAIYLDHYGSVRTFPDSRAGCGVNEFWSLNQTVLCSLTTVPHEWIVNFEPRDDADEQCGGLV